MGWFNHQLVGLQPSKIYHQSIPSIVAQDLINAHTEDPKQVFTMIDRNSVVNQLCLISACCIKLSWITETQCCDMWKIPNIEMDGQACPFSPVKGWRRYKLCGIRYFIIYWISSENWRRKLMTFKFWCLNGSNAGLVCVLRMSLPSAIHVYIWKGMLIER